MYIKEKFWVLDKNNERCYVGDVIKDKDGFVGEIIKVDSVISEFELKVKFDFGEVPLLEVCCTPNFERLYD